MKQLKNLMSLGLVAASLLTACGKPTPVNTYIPTLAPPNPTINTNVALPQVIIDNKQPTLPEGKVATAMRFDMAYESSAVPETPQASASPEAGAEGDVNAQSTTQPQADEMVVPIGTTKQFSVELTLEDAQLLSQYTRVNWVSTNRNVGSISTSGVFTPITEGTTKVIASIGGVAVTMVVNVAPGNFIWQQVQAPTKANLYGVKLVCDTDAWAVGAGGTILHFLQGRWYDLTLQAHAATNGANLYSIDMLSPYEGWAVGDNTVLHFINGVWQRIPVPAQGTFKSVDMIAPGLGWIVGDSGGSAVALRMMGMMGWQPVATGIERPLNGVSVLGPNHAWAVGDTGHLSRAGIFQFNGTTWEKVRFTNSLIDIFKPTGQYSMKAIKMVNSSQGWAVGEYDPLLSSIRGKRGAIFSYDATNDIWKEIELNADTDKRYAQVTFNAIGMMSPNQGWVLGNTITAALDYSANNQINGNLMKTEGNFLSPASDFKAQALPPAFNSIDVVEHGNGVIVGDQGFIMHRQYDLNYQYKRSNFSNFNGEYGQGYTSVNTTVPTPQGY
jgi:photosystem II stability/assembly factor-like uncharacterized protein